MHDFSISENTINGEVRTHICTYQTIFKTTFILIKE